MIAIAGYWLLMGIFLLQMKASKKKENGEKKILFEPRTAVLLPIRGADPSLENCVKNILAQKFKPYSVFFLADNETDPAVQTVRNILKTSGSEKGNLVIFEKHLPNCSLKCGSLYQMWERLKDSEFEVFVNVDSDTNPPPDWLQRLVEPLKNPNIAAASGLRWYLPENLNGGSVIRQLWNMGAVLQMFFFQIPWGGSLAVRREVFEDGSLAEIWSRSLTDDTVTTIALQRIGKKCAILPSLLLVNREECSIPAFYPWLKRQLLCVRKYHSSWNFVAFQALFLGVPVGAAILCETGSLFQEKTNLSVWAILFLSVWFLGIGTAFWFMDESVRKELRGQGEKVPQRSWRFMLGSCLLIPAAQLIYLAAALGNFRMKSVTWRGIQYVLGPKNSIQMVRYVPYAQINRPLAENESL